MKQRLLTIHNLGAMIGRPIPNTSFIANAANATEYYDPTNGETTYLYIFNFKDVSKAYTSYYTITIKRNITNTKLPHFKLDINHVLVSDTNQNKKEFPTDTFKDIDRLLNLLYTEFLKD